METERTSPAPTATTESNGAPPSRSRVRPGPVEGILIAAGLFLIWRYRFFFDDAFVYFRYVDNLLFLKIGLVYNAGEYVEGYSSPLWTLLLVPLRATGLGWETLIPAVGFIAFAAFAWMLVALNRQLSPAGITVNLPLAHLGLTYAVACSFTSGMETVLVQLTAVVFALFVLRPSSLPLQVGLALAPLVRHELAIPLLVGAGWSFLSERRPPWRLALLTAAFGAAWMIFRIVYYADIFPNTFYLKDDVAWAQGGRYVADVVRAYPTIELIVAASLLGLAAHFRGQGIDLAKRLVMLAGALPVALYVVKIGGAPIHYRYLAFPYVVIVCAMGGLPERALAALRPRADRGSGAGPRPRLVLASGLGLGLAIGGFSAAAYPRQLTKHPLREEVSFEYVDLINDAAYHRQRIGTTGRWKRKVSPEIQSAYREEHPDFAYQAVVRDGWCARAYRGFDQHVIHGYGLTDAFLARTNAIATRPAHKPRLQELAVDLVRIHGGADEPGPGMYRRAVEAGTAPDWIVQNLEAIELVERKVYNRHGLLENLRLAFTPVPRILLEQRQ